MASAAELARAFSKRNADGVSGALAGVKTVYTFSITGQSVLAQEQAPFFNAIPDVAVSANHAVLAPVQTPASGWTLLQLNEYFLTHPAPGVNMNIPNSNNSSLIAGMTLYTVRRTPDGKKSEVDLALATLQSANDYQNTRVQAELSGDVIYDGVTYPRLAWNSTTAPAASILVSWSMGESLDLRGLVQPAAPVRVG